MVGMFSFDCVCAVCGVPGLCPLGFCYRCMVDECSTISCERDLLDDVKCCVTVPH